jgi:predicted ester cyclase
MSLTTEDVPDSAHYLATASRAQNRPSSFPDVQWTLEEQIADGDRVWSRSIWQGTQRGPFLGVPSTGKNVIVAAWTIDRLTDGKIAESRIIMDTLGLIQQLA